MRPQDHSIRSRAHVLGIITVIAVGLLIRAYVIERSPLPWWLIAIGAFITAVHFYRRSRK